MPVVGPVGFRGPWAAPPWSFAWFWLGLGDLEFLWHKCVLSLERFLRFRQGELWEEIKHCGCFPSEGLWYARQMLEALVAVHDLDIVHRDPRKEEMIRSCISPIAGSWPTSVSKLVRVGARGGLTTEPDDMVGALGQNRFQTGVTDWLTFVDGCSTIVEMTCVAGFSR